MNRFFQMAIVRMAQHFQNQEKHFFKNCVLERCVHLVSLQKHIFTLRYLQHLVHKNQLKNSFGSLLILSYPLLKIFMKKDDDRFTFFLQKLVGPRYLVFSIQQYLYIGKYTRTSRSTIFFLPSQILHVVNSVNKAVFQGQTLLIT